jgi:hypothetical protein
MGLGVNTVIARNISPSKTYHISLLCFVHTTNGENMHVELILI